VSKAQSAERKAQSAFTLVEIMVATAVLSLGLVMIYQAFFISLDTFDYYLNHLNAQLWLDEMIWQMQDDFRQSGFFSPRQTSGGFTVGNRNFAWNMNYGLIEPEELYQLSLSTSWQQGSRRIRLLRTAYISNYVQEE
jgi:prepilin-type N-terminal cleavage/methylation domain-containing protein